jgi:hypothetical protein
MTKRIKEKELAVPAMKIMASQPGRSIRTSHLIKKLEDALNPDGEDAKILEGRNDTKLSQKVRNLVSHRDTATSIIKKGYVTYDAENENLTLTDLGVIFLKDQEG